MNHTYIHNTHTHSLHYIRTLISIYCPCSSTNQRSKALSFKLRFPTAQRQWTKACPAFLATAVKFYAILIPLTILIGTVPISHSQQGGKMKTSASSRIRHNFVRRSALLLLLARIERRFLRCPDRAISAYETPSSPRVLASP